MPDLEACGPWAAVCVRVAVTVSAVQDRVVAPAGDERVGLQHAGRRGLQIACTEALRGSTSLAMSRVSVEADHPLWHLMQSSCSLLMRGFWVYSSGPPASCNRHALGPLDRSVRERCLRRPLVASWTLWQSTHSTWRLKSPVSVETVMCSTAPTRASRRRRRPSRPLRPRRIPGPTRRPRRRRPGRTSVILRRIRRYRPR